MVAALSRFSRDARVRKRPEFLRVQAHGRRVLTEHLVFLVLRQPEGSTHGQPRLGITVSKRMGHAPARNRAKRLVREAFRVFRGSLEPELDLVVIVRKPLGPMKLSELSEQWKKVLSRLRAG